MDAVNSTRTGRGADTARPRPRLSIYIERHAAALISSLGVLWRTPIATLATILALGVTLVFPSLLGIASINAVSLAALWNEGGQVTVYVRGDAGPGEIDRLTALLRQQPAVRSVSHITPEAGLAEFREAAGMDTLLNGVTELEQNPLPHVLIAAAEPSATPEHIAEVRANVSSDPFVEHVQTDVEWVAKLHAGAAFVKRVFWVVAVLLGVAVVLTVANAVRAMVVGRKEEIEVQKLVGANNAFVRRPLLYAGIWLGLSGGLAAVMLLIITLSMLASPLEQIRVWLGENTWWAPGIIELFIIIMVSAWLGWAGAWMSAWHYLRRSGNQ